MAKTFEQHLQALAEGYKIEPPEYGADEIVRLSPDLSGETTSNVYAMAVMTSIHILEAWTTYGEKANVLVDSMIRNAIKSFETKSPEFAALFIGTVISQNAIKLKDPALDELCQEYMRELR